MNEEKEWDQYWQTASEKKSILGDMFTWYRKNVFARAVSFFAEKYFPKKGIFIECGSGSSQTSLRLKKYEREFIAIDISDEALKEAQKIPVITKTLKADIRKLPFDNETVDGIWNLGVMEHFSDAEIQLLLKEFKRVLKKDGTMILFWPATFGLTTMILRSAEKLIRVFKKEFCFFPDEPSIIRKMSDVKRHISPAGLYSKENFSFRDGWGHVVVVVKKHPF